MRQRQLQPSRYYFGQIEFLSHQITAYVSVPVRRFVMVANLGGWQLSPIGCMIDMEVWRFCFYLLDMLDPFR